MNTRGPRSRSKIRQVKIKRRDGRRHNGRLTFKYSPARAAVDQSGLFDCFRNRTHELAQHEHAEAARVAGTIRAAGVFEPWSGLASDTTAPGIAVRHHHRRNELSEHDVSSGTRSRVIEKAALRENDDQSVTLVETKKLLRSQRPKGALRSSQQYW